MPNATKEHERDSDGEYTEPVLASRRRVLSGVTAIGAGLALSGAAGTAGADAGGARGPPTPRPSEVGYHSPSDDRDTREVYADTFDEIIDVVEEGADNTGESDVQPLLDDLVDDNTALYFPEGTYRLDSTLQRFGGENIGILGESEETYIKHGRVDTISRHQVTEGQFSGRTRLLYFGHPNDLQTGRLVVDTISFDYRGENEGMRGVQAFVRDGLDLHYLRFLGRHDLGTEGPIQYSIYGDHGEGDLSNILMRDGGLYAEQSINENPPGFEPHGLSITATHDGFSHVKNVDCRGFPDNGIYTAPSNGRVIVENCYAQNNNVANIRVHGQGSEVRSCRIVQDEVHEFNPGGQFRGIRLGRPGSGTSDESPKVFDTHIVMSDATNHAITVFSGTYSAVVEGCTIELRDGASDGISVSGPAGDATIRNTRIVEQSGTHAFRTGSGGGNVTVENLSIESRGSFDETTPLAMCEKDDSRFEAVTIDQRGKARHGLRIGADDCSVDGGTFATWGYAVIDDEGENNTYEGIHTRRTSGRGATDPESMWLHGSTGATVIDSRIEGGIERDGDTGTVLENNRYE